MLSCSVDPGIRKVADRYKSVFDHPRLGYSELCAFFALSLYNCKGLSELARYCPWVSSVSELSRAIDGWNTTRFMRRLRANVLRRYQGKLNAEDFCYAIDDTANPKYGKGVYGVGHWHTAAGPFYGQKILVIVLVERRTGIAIPIHYAFGKKECDPDYKTMPMVAADLLKECICMGFPQLPVTADSWFDASPLMRELEDMGLSYDGELKSNRNVRGNAGPYVRERKLAGFFAGKEREAVLAKPYGDRTKGKRKRRGAKKKKFIAEAVVMINGISHPVKVIAVYNHRNDKKAFAFYVSTSRTLSGAKLWALSRSRWSIECLFRDLKQNLAFGRLPCTGKEAADLAVCIPFALVVSLRLDDPEIWGLSKDEDDPMGSKLAKVRERSLSKAIDLIASNPDHDVVKRLRARRHGLSLRRKPTDTVAAGSKKLKSEAA